MFCDCGKAMEYIGKSYIVRKATAVEIDTWKCPLCATTEDIKGKVIKIADYHAMIEKENAAAAMEGE